ncbi:MAG TPA: GPP34 family phosphoprotein [Nocardioidaceae bacterium]
MLIAEDLLLLLTDDRTGRLTGSATHVDVALGGSLLVELALMDRVALAGPGEQVREGRVVVRDGSATGDPVLDGALETVRAKQGKKPAQVVTPLGKGLRAQLYARLTDRGILRAERDKVLGVFPSQQWPAVDAEHEDAVRRELVVVLQQGATHDARVGALVSLLHALRAVPKVVDPSNAGLSRRELNAHAKQVAEGDWGSAAVRRAIDEMMAAVVAATTAATSGAASS